MITALVINRMRGIWKMNLHKYAQRVDEIVSLLHHVCGIHFVLPGRILFPSTDMSSENSTQKLIRLQVWHKMGPPHCDCVYLRCYSSVSVSILMAANLKVVVQVVESLMLHLT